jgi:hypothetical protein
MPRLTEDPLPYRYFWLEFLTAWCGGTTVKNLGSVLKMSREAVQKTVIKSAGHFALDKTAGLGLSFAGTISDIKYGPQKPSHALNAITWDMTMNQCAGLDRQIHLNFEDISSIVTDLGDNEHFRTLLSAMSSKRPIGLTYRSKKKEISGFSFSPHSVVKTSFRTHFRGYARYEDGTGKYIDLVPGRIVDAMGIDADYVGPARDSEWNTTVAVTIEPARGPDAVVKALEQELGTFPVVIKARQATARYVCETMRARTSLLETPGEFEWSFRIEAISERTRDGQMQRR